ncbi:DUF6449 domain-containing protein [Isachenkonia alkalipeptolytica]|uniref:DUF6449 domain-containing protein n=1 Tax=Isachenkonia alkalipeptolytica TaxID=2565777 RepID=A0AA43XIM3_9CLOT|nr:DUF6449 domain-containing protein [Isachenkonia alkalipeptolytica]NBG87488.1 hypothetical protein [Isachenkonia alkalipeptolytica]
MKSIKSYFDKGIMLNECKRLYWVPILYFIGLFISIPLQILLEIQRYAPDLEENRQYLRITENILEFRHPGTVIMLFVVPVAVGLLLYRYLQDRNNSDMIHSLPIRRETLYVSHGAVGVLFLLFPLLLTTGITALIHQIAGLEFIFTLQELWIWSGTILLMGLVLYGSTIFVGMVTGMTIAQGILTYIVLFLPVGLHQLIVYNMEFYLYGFSWERYGGLSAALMQRLSPLVRIGMLSGEALSRGEILAYSLFVVGILFIGLLIYKQRKLENNLQVIVFTPLKHLFKYGVTFSVMLLAGMYFYSASNGSMQWVWFGYGLFALLGYGIAEAVIQKSVRILSMKMLRGLVLYTGVMLLTIGFLTLDVTGFERRMPEKEEVQSVYIGFHPHDYQAMKNYGGSDGAFREGENIARVMEFHQMLIDYKGDIQNSGGTSLEDRPFYIVYELKEGENLTRHYHSVPREIYEEAYGALIESQEYKYSRYPVLSIPPEDFQRATIRGYTNDSQTSLLDPEQITGLVEALQKDLLEAGHEALYNQEVWGGVTLLLEEGKEVPSLYGPGMDNELHVTWSKEFNETEKWLEEEGLLEEVRLTGDQVAYMVVEPFEGSAQVFYGDSLEGEAGANQGEGKGEDQQEEAGEVRRYETRDDEEIEAALRLSENGWRDKRTYGYRVGYYDEGGNQILLESFRKDRVPTFVEAFYQ